jgi:hypothetical protein
MSTLVARSSRLCCVRSKSLVLVYTLWLALSVPVSPASWGRLHCLSSAAGCSCGPSPRPHGILDSLRGGGYAYTKPGARLDAIRNTPGQVHVDELPRFVEPEIDRTFDVESQTWHGHDSIDRAELYGKVGMPPLPERVPEIVQLALGTRLNSPIHEKIAEAWVLAKDKRLIEKLSVPREEDITPNVCATCLGPAPETVRMLRHLQGTPCKICAGIYTIYHWRPSTIDVRLKVRWKRTIICQPCAAAKNACQGCLRDMQYALPIAVRDALVLPAARRPPPAACTPPVRVAAVRF